MFTRMRKTSALAAGFIFLGLAASGCELVSPVGPSSFPAAIGMNATDHIQAAVPTRDQDSGLELSPGCVAAASVPDEQRWAARAPGTKPICR
jgi:hypothetical protein